MFFSTEIYFYMICVQLIWMTTNLPPAKILDWVAVALWIPNNKKSIQFDFDWWFFYYFKISWKLHKNKPLSMKNLLNLSKCVFGTVIFIYMTQIQNKIISKRQNRLINTFATMFWFIHWAYLYLTNFWRDGF